MVNTLSKALPGRYFSRLICFFLFIHYSPVLAQSHLDDSLYAVLKTEKEDTNKANTLNLLSVYLRMEGDFDTSMYYAKNALAISEKKGYKKGLAAAYRNIGIAYASEGDYSKSLDNFFKALDINEETGNKNGIAAILGNIGNVYRTQGNYPKALEFDFKALDITQELHNKAGIAANMGNIGSVYTAQGNYPKALQYDTPALSIYTELGNKSSIARNLGNIGNVYDAQGIYSKALRYDLKALYLDSVIGEKPSMATNLGNIGVIYDEQHNYTAALDYDFRALAIDREIGEKEGIAANLNNIGTIYLEQKKYGLAKSYLDSALTLSKEIGQKEDLVDAYHFLAIADSAQGNYKQEAEDYKKFIIYKDSLLNEANTKKTVQAEMNFEFEQKQAAEKAEQDKKDAIATQEKNKQLIIRNAFIAGFALMLALVFFIFKGYRQKQKANVIITLQKDEVIKQKALVEEKNRDILDSITYAKRLQDAILPPMSLIKQHLPESFLLYKPKDIVAGDFYWMEAPNSFEGKTGTILIAAADCTGHGVPGAMVSVVCSNALNRTVKEFKITEPGKILDKVRELVLETFEKSEGNIQDGMDISLASLNHSKGEFTLSWAGAYNSLWFIPSSSREGQNEVIEINGDKQPIGKTDNPQPFTTHSITLNNSSADRKAGTLYLFTDGYADQFGGPKGKKFKYQQLKQLLADNCNLPMDKQKELLEAALVGWQGELEQVDDILVIGIRI